MYDYLARDGILFVAFLGFVPLVLAANAATGGRRALVQVAGSFLAAGAVFGALNAVAFLTDTSWWRATAWHDVPGEVMVAVGRGTEPLADLSAWSGVASNAAFAIGLYYLARVCLEESALPRRLAPLAIVGAVCEIVLVGIVMADLHGIDLVETSLQALAGVVVGQIVAIWLGLHLARVLRARAEDAPDGSSLNRTRPA